MRCRGRGADEACCAWRAKHPVRYVCEMRNCFVTPNEVFDHIAFRFSTFDPSTAVALASTGCCRRRSCAAAAHAAAPRPPKCCCCCLHLPCSSCCDSQGWREQAALHRGLRLRSEALPPMPLVPAPLPGLGDGAAGSCCQRGLLNHDSLHQFTLPRKPQALRDTERLFPKGHEGCVVKFRDC